MLKLFQTLILVTLTLGFVYAQEIKSELTGDLKTDFRLLVPNGQVNVDIIDGFKIDPRYELLNSKFLTAFQQNTDWFLEQQKIVEKTGKPLSYHPNIGMTEEEWIEYQTIMRKGPGVELLKNGSALVTFNYNGDLVTLKGTDRLSVLDKVKINLEENIVWIGDYKLDNFSEIKVETEDNGLKSKWQGYSWRFDYPSNSKGLDDINSSDELQSLELKIYKFTIGRLEKDNSTYIEITEKEIEKGIKIKNIQIPFTFKLIKDN